MYAGFNIKIQSLVFHFLLFQEGGRKPMLVHKVRYSFVCACGVLVSNCCYIGAVGFSGH